jgi:hypothetical protein
VLKNEGSFNLLAFAAFVLINLFLTAVAKTKPTSVIFAPLKKVLDVERAAKKTQKI